MHLSSLFRPDLIMLRVPVESRDEAIRIMTARVAETHRGLDPELLLEKVREREAMISTVFPTGVAIPHARIVDFEDMVIAVLAPEKPVEGVRLFFLILTDLARSNLYLNVLAAISSISRGEETVRDLADSESPREFIRTLEAFDIEVKKTVLVRDLMSAPPQVLHPDCSVKDALNFMTVNHFAYIPVCEDNRKLVGEISVHDILSIGLPRYAQMLTNLKFLSSLEPFEDLLRNEASITLRSIMRTPPVVLSPDAVVFEAVFQIIRNNRRHLPVARDGECVGVLSHMDLVTKYLRV